MASCKGTRPAPVTRTFVMKYVASWIGSAAFICAVVATASGTADEGRMPDLDGAVAWLNSPQLSSKSLCGKVVLVDFWTYTCNNSPRPLLYVKSWAARYKDAGFVGALKSQRNVSV